MDVPNMVLANGIVANGAVSNEGKGTKRILSAALLLSLLFSGVSCGGGGGGGDGDDRAQRSGIDAANFDCDGTCPNQSLSEGDVTRILQQAVTGAQQINQAATIAVTDRVGNVLGVYQMD